MLIIYVIISTLLTLLVEYKTRRFFKKLKRKRKIKKLKKMKVCKACGGQVNMFGYCRDCGFFGRVSSRRHIRSAPLKAPREPIRSDESL